MQAKIRAIQPSAVMPVKIAPSTCKPLNMTQSLLRLCFCFLLALWLPLSGQAQTPEKCVAKMTALKTLLHDPSFSMIWEETTMDDGKPLVVSITDKNGALSVAFNKTSKGLWAEIEGEICRTDKGLEIRFTGEQIHFGPAASWVLRYALGNGGKFTLTKISDKQMQVSTTGWSGTFAAVEK